MVNQLKRRVIFPIQRLWDRFCVILDSEAAVLYQAIIAIALIITGFQDLFIANEAPLTLQPSMSWIGFQGWCVMAMLGPIQVVVGRWVAKTRFWMAGLYCRLFGNLVVLLVLLAYTLGTFKVEPWGTGGFGGYMGLALIISVAFFIIRVIRLIRQHR